MAKILKTKWFFFLRNAELYVVKKIRKNQIGAVNNHWKRSVCYAVILKKKKLEKTQTKLK